MQIIKLINGADLELERRPEELQQKVKLLEEDKDQLKELLPSREGDLLKEIDQRKHFLK